MKQFYYILRDFFTVKERRSFLKTDSILIFFLCCSCFSSNAQNIAITALSKSSVCEGTTIIITFSVTNGSSAPFYNTATLYQAFLSDASGVTFSAIGVPFTKSGPYSPTAGAIRINLTQVITIPTGTPAGNFYKLALGSSSPTFNGSAGAGASGTFTVNPKPTISTVTQVGVGCAGSGATISLTGLIPNATSTISYKVQGTGSAINVDVVADASGAATFTSATSVSANQTITVNSVSSNGCSQSFSIKSASLNFNPAPGLTGASQAAAAICAGSGAVINLTGLGSNSTSTINYTINGTPYQIAGIVATGTNASFTSVAVTAANDGQILKITGITRTDLPPGCFKTFNFDVILKVSPYINKTVIADPASVCVLNSSVIKIFSPDPRVRYQLRNDFDDSPVGVPVTSIISPLKLPVPKGYLTGNTTFNILATDTTTGCSAELLTTPTITVTTGATIPVASITSDYCTLGDGKVLLSSANSHSSYLWNNDSTQNSITINQAGIYTLTVTDANGCRADTTVNIGDEQVINGNINQGVGIGYTTQYTFTAAYRGLQTPGAGWYSINQDANFTSAGFWGKDHTTQTGNFMIINGSGAGGSEIWTTKVKVIPNTRYYFSAWAMSMNAVGPFARLQFNVNGTNVGSIASLTAGVSNSSNNGWLRFYGSWDSGTNNDSIIIKTVNLETSGSGNDFGLDDISFSKLPPVSFFGTTLGNNGNSVCSSDTLTLTALLTGGSSPFTYSWSWPGFTSSAVSPVILNAPGGWYYSTITDGNACQRKDSVFIIVGNPTLSTLTLDDACSSNIVVVARLGGMVANSINNTVYYKIASGARRTATGVNVDAAGNASFLVAGVVAGNNGNVVSVDSVFNGSCTLNLFPSSKTAPIVIKTTGEWIGGAAGNWNVPGNWCGGIPAAGATVTIPAGSVITVPSGFITNNVNNLTVNGTLVLTNSTLRITNTITTAVGGIFNATNGTVELAGNAVQSISGKSFLNSTVKSLVISNPIAAGVNAIDSLNILDTLAFTVSNATLNTGNNIVFSSNATSTARLTDITKNGTLSGNKIVGRVTVQRYYPQSRAWRLVTSPLSNTGSILNNWQNAGNYVVGNGMFVTGPNPNININGLDNSNFNNFSMRGWNSSTSSYKNIGNTKDSLLSGNLLTPGKAVNVGYYAFVRGDRRRSPDNTIFGNMNNTTLSSTGNLQTGTQTFDLTSGAGTFALIGNPYVSSVDFSKLTMNNVNPYKFYTYDPAWNTVGVFVTMDDFDQNGIFEPIPFFSTQTNHIQSSQAFFVEVTGGGAAIIFNESNKSANYNPALFRPIRPAAEIQSLRVNLFHVNADKSTIPVDGTLVKFDDQYNDRVDMQDALKFTNISENLSMLRYKQFLVLERRPLIKDNDTIFLQLTRTTRRSYRFAIEPTNLPVTITAFLEDSYTKLSTPINILAPSNFDFAITSDAKSSVANRFRIVFKQAALGPLPVTFKTIKANEQTGKIAVNWTVENELNIKNYEVEKSSDGVIFDKVNATAATGANRSSTSYNWLDPNPLSGNNFYRVRSVGLDGKFDYSNVVLVKMGTMESGVRIYPNPVTDNVIGAEFKNMAAGIYKVRLLNAQGQMISNKIINHAPGTSMEYIQPGYKLPSGIYQLEITAPEKAITIVKVIVQ